MRPACAAAGFEDRTFTSVWFMQMATQASNTSRDIHRPAPVHSTFSTCVTIVVRDFIETMQRSAGGTGHQSRHQFW
jgi:hypothetical protein